VPIFTAQDTYYSQLTLASNKITALKAWAFQGLNINDLDLTDNLIETVESTAFYGLETGLVNLAIQLSPTAAFPASALNGLANVKVFEVSGFGGTSLPADALRGMIHLKELRLINGNLEQINTNDLQFQQDTLDIVNLSGNHISDVSNVGVSSLTSLKTLLLTSNSIRGIQANGIKALPLEVLDLSNNGLSSNLNADAFQSVKTSLKVLKLMSCQLSDASLNSIKPLKLLTELYLQINSISNLPANIFSNSTSLRKLYLNNNPITTLTRDSFNGLAPSLWILYIGENLQTRLAADAFKSLTALQELSIERMGALSLDPDIFSSQQMTLKTLSISFTSVGDQVFQAVGSLKILERLALTNASITAIPDFAFRLQGQLRSIDVSSNSITVITQSSLSGLQNNLMSLNLANNRITTVDSCVFYQFRIFDFFQLGLSGNALKCDCRMLWLYRILKQTDPRRFTTISWACPSNSKLFNDMSESEFGCSGANSSTPTVCVESSTVGPSVKPQVIILNISNKTSSSVYLAWSVMGASNIQSFTLSCQPVNTDQSQVISTDVPGDVRSYTLSSLTADTSYQVCVTMNIGSDWTLPKTTCDTVKTLVSSKDITDNSKRDLGIILGSIFGGLLLVSIAIIVCVVLVRRRKKKKERETVFRKYKKDTANVSSSSTASSTVPTVSGDVAGTRSTEGPQIKQESRRYSKNAKYYRGKGLPNNDVVPDPAKASQGETVNGKKAGTLQSFTSEEQDRILAMLTSAPMTRLHSTSVSSMNSGGARYVAEPRRAPPSPAGHGALGLPFGISNEAYRRDNIDERRDNIDERGNVYNEIPESGYENLPYDTVV